MHLPALLAGLLLSPASALSAAVLMPWVSMGLTGMPPLPFALLMTIELGVLVISASVLRHVGASVWIAAAVALLLRIAVTYGVVAWLSSLLSLPPDITASAAVISGLPGVVLQIAVAPTVALAVLRRSWSKS
jgi:niacin transporter